MMFHVGQKVVCVDDAPPLHNATHLRLTLNAIYTVRGFDPESAGGAVYLHELPDDPPFPGWRFPCGWRPTRFRPVTERKTDISSFTRMLTPKHARDLVQS